MYKTSHKDSKRQMSRKSYAQLHHHRSPFMHYTGLLKRMDAIVEFWMGQFESIKRYPVVIPRLRFGWCVSHVDGKPVFRSSVSHTKQPKT